MKKIVGNFEHVHCPTCGPNAKRERLRLSAKMEYHFIIVWNAISNTPLLAWWKNHYLICTKGMTGETNHSTKIGRMKVGKKAKGKIII